MRDVSLARLSPKRKLNPQKAVDDRQLSLAVLEARLKAGMQAPFEPFSRSRHAKAVYKIDTADKREDFFRFEIPFVDNSRCAEELDYPDDVN